MIHLQGLHHDFHRPHWLALYEKSKCIVKLGFMSVVVPVKYSCFVSVLMLLSPGRLQPGGDPACCTWHKVCRPAAKS